MTHATRPRSSQARRIQYPRDRGLERWWDLFPLDLEWPIDMDQGEYLEILFADLGFAPGGRRAWLRAEYGGRAHFDELSWPEKSKLINRLKALKAAQRETTQAHADEASGMLDFE